MADQSDRQDDEVKPWTIKGVGPEARNAATAAANREKATIGEWISRAIRTQIQSDHQRDRVPVVVGPTTAAPVGIDEIERLITATADLARATGEPPPRAVSKAAYAVLRQRLGGSGPTATRASRTSQVKSPTRDESSPTIGGNGQTSAAESPTEADESPT